MKRGSPLMGGTDKVENERGEKKGLGDRGLLLVIAH